MNTQCCPTNQVRQYDIFGGLLINTNKCFYLLNIMYQYKFALNVYKMLMLITVADASKLNKNAKAFLLSHIFLFTEVLPKLHRNHP